MPSTLRALATAVALSAAVPACDNGLDAPPTPLISLSGGNLTMGSTAACSDATGVACGGDRAPHAVRLSPFEVERTEVTRLQFANCVVAGACDESAALPFDADHKSEPVLVDNPEAARQYCRWRGLSLPTEAQFEFAARVDRDGKAHDYPWGDTTPTCDRVLYDQCGQAALRDVGTTPGDVSSQGVYDLAGGVPEWVEDSYDPHAGCLGRVGFSDVCVGQPAGCEGGHCVDAQCVHGCLPPAEDTASVMQGSGLADAPQCQLVPAGETAPLDPVIRTSSEWGVVRGGGRLDRSCALAGWSRRHAAPGSFHAGFRCARTQGGFASTPLGAYRFRLSACPTPGHLVDVKLGDANDGGKPIDFLLDHVGGSGAIASVHADGGVVRMMPCGDAFVIRPVRNAVLQITVTDYLGCAGWSQRVSLALGGDLPAVGTDLLSLTGASSCALPRGVGSCAGTCKVDRCDKGFADCDGDFADGCEKDVQSDKDNCGRCGNACPALPNSAVACLAGVCGIAACSPPRFSDCDAQQANGCEVDLTTDPFHCGGCRAACSSNHIGLPTCVASVCGGTCEVGWDDCNSNKQMDGCEVQTGADPANCGGCGMACSTANIDRACTGGTCTGRCLPNFGDCNNDKRGDGCEASLETDPKNCGVCGRACAQGKSCVAGQCQ